MELETWHVTSALFVLCTGCVGIMLHQRSHSASMQLALHAEGSAGCTPAVMAEFRRFQTGYLVVYLLCSFSDWLKGPYVYALYEQYGFNKLQIAWLFVGGFFSSLVFGTFVGSLSDKFGRRRMCLIFCIVYAASACTKLVNSFAVLLLGRVLSGVATSLLFTSFESWMVAEHRARQFPEQLIANTFSHAVFGNGVVAVFAGFVAQAAASCCGYVAPFLVAVPCLGVAYALILRWPENYGNQSMRVRETLVRGWEAIARERKLQYLGATQALFEGCMYVWVFIWTPSLAAAAAAAPSFVGAAVSLGQPLAAAAHATALAAHGGAATAEAAAAAVGSGGESLTASAAMAAVALAAQSGSGAAATVVATAAASAVPFGLVFSCYMGALMIGGALTDLLPLESLLLPLHGGAVAAMAAAALWFDKKPVVFLAFTLFEGLVGTYFGAHGMLRSLHIEEAARSSVMNLFRVPMNVFVVVVLQLEWQPQTVLLFLTVAHMGSLLCLRLFLGAVPAQQLLLPPPQQQDRGSNA